MDNVIAEESADGRHKVRVGEEEEEAVNEATGGVVVDESADGGPKVQLGEEESLKETVGDAIVEESADGESKVQVEDEETLNETMGNAIVEESTDGECKVQVRDENTLNETTGSAIVEEITDGEHKEQVSEEEALNETTGNAIVGESTDAEPKAQVREEEALNEAAGDIVVGESTDGEHKAQVGGEEVFMETLGNDIVEDSTDGENQAQVRKEGALIETMDNVIVAKSEHKALVKEEETLNGTMGNDIFEESNDVEHRGQVKEEEASNETMGNAIVEESTEGDHKAQVAEAEALTETMGNVITVESTYAEHKAQVREVKALTETMGNVLIEESSDVKHKAQVGEAEALTETIGDVIMEESRDVEHKTRVLEAEALTETIGDVIMEESTAGGRKAHVGEAEHLTETIGNVIITESTAGERKAQLGEEVLNKTVKQAMQSMASGSRIIPPMENDQHVTYHLPSLDKASFSISDLVWGKVKSHPWWPGQIFDPSDASKLATKYQKKDSFLISYYGDKTFAWCDESQLKPFHSYFSQLEKQCSSDTFIKAIHDILMEVSRRVELGMACSCLPEEDYTKIKYQKVENAGIRGGNINSIIDRSTVANYFEPEKLLEYIKTLAQFPNGRVDKLEFAIARSQLKTFYHSKGYPELPIFTVGGGLKESVPENSPSCGKGSTEDFVEQCTPVLSDLISEKKTSKSVESSFNKREHGVEDDVKQKSTSKLTEDGKAVNLANGGKGKSLAKAAGKPISSFSGKKHIIVESDPADSERCKKRILDSFEDIECKSPSTTGTSSFKIGEFIRRAASQLTGGPLILKCQGETLQKDGPQDDHKIDYVADFDVPPDSPVENLRTNLSFTEDYNSPDELLSQLCLAARDPMEEHSFVSTIVDFFTDFRNFCVSSSSEDKEHIEKRKRGRPRKVISQQAASDIITSEDEKQVEKCKRGMNMISRLASSDISSENEKPVEKPVEKRKRGRPRKNPLPASSDSEDVKPLQKPKRGRPRKVYSQLASPDYSSFESKKLVETHKRGRPRTEIVPADMATPDHIKDTYWSDMDLQKKRNGKSLVQYQKKRRKSTGEQSLCQLTPTLEHQLQLALNPDMKLTFVAERSIISVEEKIMDECMPTALILVFNNANSLPSETHLIRIFSRYGPLKEAETEVIRKTNRARVVFKRRVDAEAAFSSAGKYSIFGPELLSYQLKPWSPKSTPPAMPLGTQEAAPTAMTEDTHDAAHIVSPTNTRDTAPITVPQDNLIAAFIPTPEDKHDLAPVVTAQDYHDLAPIPMVQDNHDTAHDKCISAGISVGGNLELSVHAETVIAASEGIQVEAEDRESSGKHDPELISTSHENQDSVVVSSLLDEHNLTPTSTEDNLDAATITMLQDNPDAAVILTLQNKCDAEPTVGSSMELSEQAEDVIALKTIQVEAEGKESSPHDKHGPGLIAAPEEKQDAVPIASLFDEHDLTPTSTKGKLDAAPNTMVEDSRDAAAVITPQDKCDAGRTIRSNLELSEQAEDVIASDTIQMEVEGEESSPHDKHEPALIATPQENQDMIPVAYPLDEHDLTPTSTKDKLDAAPNTMVEDSRDVAAVITPQDKCDAGRTIGSNLELSEQAEDLIASDTIQMEVEGEESSSHDKHEPALIATPQENQDMIPVALPQDEDDSTPITTQDNLDGAPNTMGEDSRDAAAIITLQDKCDAGRTIESNLELSEQAEDVIAADTIQMEVEGEESSSHDKYEQALIATPQENQDMIPVASPQDEDDSTPITTQDNLDGASITMVEDNPDATHVLTPQHKYDAELVVRSNLEFSEQVEAVVASDAAQVEVEGKESLPRYSEDPALMTVPEQNQIAEHCTSLLDQHDSTPTTTLDNLDAAQISLPQDNHDSTSFDTSQDNQDAEPIASLPPDNHDAAPIAKPQENHDSVSIATPPNHPDATSITTPQDNHDAGSISTPEDCHDLAPITTEQDCHDLAPITTVRVNQDAAPIIALQEKCDMEPTVGSNLELSEHVEDVSNTIQVEAEGEESLPQDKHNPALITTTQQNQDAEPISALLDKHDSTPPITQADLDASSICMPQDNQDAEPTASLPHDYHGAAPITIPQDNHEAVSIATPPEHCDVITPITASHDDRDAAPIATTQDKNDLGPIILTQDSHDLAPMTTVEVNHDAADVITLQDKCDPGHSVGVGSNLKLSEQAEGTIASDTVQVEAEGEVSPPQDRHDRAPIATPKQNQDTEPVASLLDRHDSLPATTQDNLDAATSITMMPDNHDVAPVTTPQDTYNAALTEGCNIQVSEQAESGVTSETKVEDEGCNLEVSERAETGTASDDMQI